MLNKKTSSDSDGGLARDSFPQPFGRYELLERMGSGGMADVFRAACVGSQGFRRVVVIKRVRSALAGSPEMLGLFRDEARISALLNHPNIVQVHDFGRVDGAPFLAMEYVQGRDLRAVLRALTDTRRRMQPSTAALIGRQVAQALHYAHTLRDTDNQHFRIVHRDINPTNLMLARSGMVKVLDFGVAKASVHAGKAQTNPPAIKGKLSYLSPEQALCHPAGRAVGRVLAGRDAVGDADGAAAVRGADGVRAHPATCWRRRSSRRRRWRRASRRCWTPSSARAGTRRRASAIRTRRRWPRTLDRCLVVSPRRQSRHPGHAGAAVRQGEFVERGAAAAGQQERRPRQRVGVAQDARPRRARAASARGRRRARCRWRGRWRCGDRRPCSWP